MAEEEEFTIDMAIEAMQENEQQLEAAFAKRANKKKLIDLKGIPGLIDDVTEILSFDCEDAKEYFSKDNDSIPAGYDLNALTYKQFVEVFQNWLKDGAEEEDEEAEEEEEEKPAKEKPKQESRKNSKESKNEDSIEEVEEEDEEEEPEVKKTEGDEEEAENEEEDENKDKEDEDEREEDDEEKEEKEDKEENEDEEKDEDKHEEEGDAEEKEDKAGKKSERKMDNSHEIPNSFADRSQVDSRDHSYSQGFYTYHKPQKAPAKKPKKYEKLKKQFAELFKRHRAEYEEIFNKRLRPNEKTISIHDCFGFFQDCFYVDHVELRDEEGEASDFFRKQNSYKKVYNAAEEFLLDEKGRRSPRYRPHEATFSFEGCFELLDYLFRVIDTLVIVDNRENVRAEAEKKPILDTLHKYEKMLKDADNDIERQVLKQTIDNLWKKVQEVDANKVKRQAMGNKKKEVHMTKEEKRAHVLKEIFDFYCRQQIILGKYCTFDKLDRIVSTINMGTFKVFLKNFRLKMDHHKLMELYKKNAGLDENLTYEEFEKLLKIMALRADLITHIRTHTPKPEIMKDYKPDSYKHDYRYREFKEKDAERREEFISTLVQKQKHFKDETKRDEEQLEEVYEHMGIYDGRYKKYMKDAPSLPFNSNVKDDFRIPSKPSKYRFKPKWMQGKTDEEIKEEIQRRNDMRRLVKDIKSTPRTLVKTYRKGKKSSRAPSPVEQAKKAGENIGYVKKLNQKAFLLGNVPNTKEMTMKNVHKILHGDIRKVEETFNPKDLILDDDDEDDQMYLSEYNLRGDKHELARQAAERRKLENYGNLKHMNQTPSRYSQAQYYDAHRSKSTVNHYQAHHGYYTEHSPTNNKNYGSHSPVKRYPSPKRNSEGLRSHKSAALMMHYDSAPEYDHQNYKNSPYRSPKQHHVSSSLNMGPAIGQYSGHSGHYANNSPSQHKPNNGYYSMMDRAHQIENDSKRREQKMMNHVMNIHGGQVQRGLKAVGK